MYLTQHLFVENNIPIIIITPMDNEVTLRTTWCSCFSQNLSVQLGNSSQSSSICPQPMRDHLTGASTNHHSKNVYVELRRDE